MPKNYVDLDDTAMWVLAQLKDDPDILRSELVRLSGYNKDRIQVALTKLVKNKLIEYTPHGRKVL